MDQVGEWLASPYSASEGGLGCIDCHGRSCSGTKRGEFFDRASSGDNLESLRQAVRLALTATWNGDVVEAEVAVTNVGAGHHLPTGSSTRSLALELVAQDPNSQPLRPCAEPRSPSVSTRGIRLAPFGTHVSHCRFEAPGDGPAQVNVRLLLVPAEGDPVEIASTAAVCRNPALPP
jgi:hypothetical protein